VITPIPAKLSRHLRPDNGDVLAIWKLARLGRSVKDVLTIADNLHKRGIGMRVLTGKLSGTYSPTGEGKFFTMMAAFAELKRHFARAHARQRERSCSRRHRIGACTARHSPPRLRSPMRRVMDVR